MLLYLSHVFHTQDMLSIFVYRKKSFKGNIPHHSDKTVNVFYVLMHFVFSMSARVYMRVCVRLRVRACACVPVWGRRSSQKNKPGH